MEEIKQKIKDLGEIVNGGIFVETGRKVRRWSDPSPHPGVYEEDVIFQKYEFFHLKYQRKKARRELKKYIRSKDDEIRILAKQEYGPTVPEKFKGFIMEFPLLSAILFGVPVVYGLGILWSRTELLKYFLTK